MRRTRTSYNCVHLNKERQEGVRDKGDRRQEETGEDIGDGHWVTGNRREDRNKGDRRK